MTPMSRACLEQTIRDLAAKGNLFLRPALVTDLVYELEQAPAGLSLLQRVLTGMWLRRGEMDPGLAFNDMGLLRGVSAKLVDEAISADKEEDVHRLSIRLVRVEEDDSIIPRRVHLEEIAPALKPTAEELIEKRALVADWDARRKRATLEMPHESLVKGWDKLRRWMDADRAFLLWRQDLHWMMTWTQRGTARRLLLDEQSLQEAQCWVQERSDDLLEQEKHFVDVSRIEQQRDIQERTRRAVIEERWRGVKIALGCATLMFIIWLVWHLEMTGQEALRSRSVALSAESLRLAERDFDLAVLLALQASRIADTTEAHGALLELMAGNPHLKRFLPHEEKMILATAFGPKGEVATGGAGKVYLWDSERGVPLRAPLSILPSSQILGLTFSENGAVLAASSESGGVYIWNLRNGRSLDPIETEEPVRTLAFSSEGLLAGGTGTGDAKIFIWNKSGEILHTLPTQGQWISGLAFGPGPTLAAVIEDTTVALWDARGGQRLWSSAIEPGEKALGVSVRPGGQLLTTGTTLNRWDAATGRRVGPPCALAFGKDDEVTSVAFSRDGAMIASGHLDRKIHLWNVPDTGRCRLTSTLTGHTGFIWSMAFGRGRRLVSGGAGGDVILWKTNAPVSPFSHLVGKPRGLATLAVSPIAPLVAVGDSVGRVFLYRYDTDPAVKIDQLQSRAQSSVNRLAFSPDGRVLAAGGRNGKVLLWEVQSRQLVGFLKQPESAEPDPVSSLAFCPEDKAWVAAGTNAGQLIVWNIENGTKNVFREHIGQLLDLVFVPGTECQRLVTAGNDRRLILWDLEQEKWIYEVPDAHTEAITSLAFGKDALLASGSYDGHVRLWDVGDTLEPEGTLNGPIIFDLVFSRDGSILGAAGMEGDAHQVLLWNMETRTPIGRGFQSPTKVVSLAFAEDGAFLLTTGRETVSRWDLSPQTWRSRLCQVVNRKISKEEWERYMAKDDYEPICAPDPILPETTS